MTRFVLRRSGQAVIVVFLVTVVVFLLQHLEPGSEARAVLGSHASKPQILAFDRANGLNHALPIQYLTYLGHLLQGNLGYSYQLNESVRALIAQDVVNDLIIVGIGIVLALIVAIPIGLIQAVRRNKVFDHAATTVMFIFYSTPSFLLGLLLVAVFAVEFRVLPSQVPGNVTGLALLGQPQELILPVLTVALVTMALFSRYMRSSGIDKLTQDYIRTAKAKGVSGSGIIRRHVFRNASLPLVTLLGLSLPTLFTAGLVAEQIFNVQGVGLAFYNAVLQQDYPVELGVTLLVAVATVIGNLAADLAYAMLDPTIRSRS
jgi:peptide/nickel transport system permease protein